VGADVLGDRPDLLVPVGQVGPVEEGLEPITAARQIVVQEGTTSGWRKE
jgi:hypothetical protein